MKKAISVFLSVLMVISIIPAFTAFADDSGKCGDNLTWTLNNGVVTISGTGDMYDYASNNTAEEDEANPSPWDMDKNITKVVVNSGVTSIGREAFYYCDGITEVVLSDTIEKINAGAFAICKKLDDITIPEKTTYIGDYAFCYTPLSKLVVPKNVKTIGSAAFIGCKQLESISLPGSLRDIGENAFIHTKYYDDENNWDNGALYIDSALIWYKGKNCETYTVKEGTTVIARQAFAHKNKSLKAIKFPSSLKSLPMSVFWPLLNGASKGMYDIFIPKNVTKIINDYTLSKDKINSIKISPKNTVYDSRNGCNAIIVTKTNKMIFACNKTTIPNTVKTIGDQSFDSVNKKKYIYIPKSVKKIEVYAFGGSQNIKTIYYGGSAKQWSKTVVYAKWGDKELYTYEDLDGYNNSELYCAMKFYNCTPIKVKKLTAGKKKFTVKYNKLGSASGYQIQYSTDKNFKKNVHKVTVKGNKTFKRTIKVKKAKKYYVRVRGYRRYPKDMLVSLEKRYGNWSKVKTVKINK